MQIILFMEKPIYLNGQILGLKIQSVDGLVMVVKPNIILTMIIIRVALAQDLQLRLLWVLLKLQ
jgi:hypothetical protein